jgi:hypothetical protein
MPLNVAGGESPALKIGSGLNRPDQIVCLNALAKVKFRQP